MERELAFKILLRVVYQGAYANIELNNTINNNNLDDKAKGLLTNLVYGVLQNYWYLQYQLEGKMVKSNKRINIILCLGVYEILFLRIPKYATVNQYVEMAKYLKFDKVINAILRNFEEREVEGRNELDELAIRTSHPYWMVNMIAKHYGKERAIAFCNINNVPPKNIARLNTLKSTREEIEALGFIKTDYAPDAYSYPGNIAVTEAFQTGKVTIQDESSQLVARALDPQPGETVLDMCAAPGSKSTHLAQLMENKGKIYAFDIHNHKINLINNGAKRLGVDIIEAAAYDSINLGDKFEKETFVKILLDAPCSGFGVIRRKPDMKIGKVQDDLDGLIDIQADLLDSAHNLLKVGGRLVYSTCTINKKENETQIKRFMEHFIDMKLIKEELIFPDDHDSDGFYIAIMEKV